MGGPGEMYPIKVERLMDWKPNKLKKEKYVSLPDNKLTFVSGQRGTPKLVIDGYSFVRNKCNVKHLYWRCSKMRSTKCKAKAVTTRADQKLSVTQPNHNHEPDFAHLII